jgi:prepilin-type N-terminal cleavage/methylation domain-containing protein
MRQRGMTLIEVLVAMLIATVGLLGGLAMIGSVMGGGANARHASEAQVLAQSRLEQLQSLAGVSAVLDTGTYSFTTPVPVFAKEVVGDGTGGSAQPMDATGISNTSNTNLNIFIREVSWQSYTDPSITGPFALRRLITVRVCWFDGVVGIGTGLTCNPVGTSPPSGYHEIIVAGVRLP